MKKIYQTVLIVMAAAVFISGCELTDEGGKKMLPFSDPGIPVSDDAALKSLTVANFSISPEFDSDTLEYSLYVAKSTTTSLEIQAIGPDGATLTASINAGDPITITGPDYIITAPLNDALTENDIVFTVVSEDTLQTTTYTLRVYYLSSDAGLTSLSVSADASLITTPFAPAFNPAEASGTVHTITLSHLATQITINLAPGSPAMTAMVDGWDASNYGFAVPIADLPPTAGTLADRTRDITVAVTSQDKSTTVNYIIRVTMDLAPSNEARLSALKFEVEWYLDFSSSFSERNIGFNMDDYLLSYTRIWSDSAWRAYRLTATPVSSEITSIKARGSYITGSVSMTSNGDGSYSITVDRGYGNSLSYPLTVYIDITAKDTVTVKTYTITIYPVP